MLEITFLGTSTGVPTPKRNHSAIYLKYEENCFLWDCGEGTQRQIFQAGLNFMRIDRIFITHWHADHWAGLIGLLMTMNLEKRKKPLEIYGPEAKRFVSDLMDMNYWGNRFEIKPIDVQFQKPEVTTILKGKDFSILSVPVKHSIPAVAYCFEEHSKINVDIKKAESFGLKQGPLIGKLKAKGEIEFKGKKITLEDVSFHKKGLKVTYSGDTRPVQTVIDLAKDSDLLIHESTFGDEFEDYEDRHHTKAADAAKIAKKANVKKLILTHFSRRYQNVMPLLEQAQKVFPNTEAAKDFLSIRLKN